MVFPEFSISPSGSFLESFINEFLEVCSTWKDGCIAFSSEHIQISKYYLDGPDSKPYQKCKVINLMHFRFLSDSHWILVGFKFYFYGFLKFWKNESEIEKLRSRDRRIFTKIDFTKFKL